MPDPQETSAWTVEDSIATYSVDRWSAGFFGVNQEGHVVVRPSRGSTQGIDLKNLVEDLRQRGYQLPLLLRFRDILAERVREVGQCFANAIDEYDYRGSYRGVYPIKVNQQAQVVEELLSCGRDVHLGLEVGSKPELLVALALVEDPEALIVCNGYKDEAYVETALLAQKLGRQPVLVMDRYRELDMILRVARENGIRPKIGVRTKLVAPGAGHWAESGGDGSKFGLTTSEVMNSVDRLRDEGLLDCLELLHFHIGSQVPAIRTFKEALREASRVFVELQAAGVAMRYFDVGGGLAVDYDGSNTDFHSSMNYSVQEYANDVVATIGEACEQRGFEHPIIISESGRALVAHHAVLVFDVLDTHRVTESGELDPPSDDAPDVVHDLHETLQVIKRRHLLEPYHDAVELREQANQLFNLGYLDLRARAQAEKTFFACCTKLYELAQHRDHVPEELDGLERMLADTYFCNFSLFQSMPDSWAVDQLFPIMPIHRLEERPTRKGTIADITCDSDGRIDSFADLDDVRAVLDLHAPNGEPYYLAAFLVGAYQEILGDLHNLFGDTNAFHVALVDGRYRVVQVELGDTISEVLHYVAFDRRDLVRRLQRACEESLWQSTITPAESALLLKRFEEGLNAYTYLTDDRARLKTATRAREPASEPTPRSDS